MKGKLRIIACAIMFCSAIAIAQQNNSPAPQTMNPNPTEKLVPQDTISKQEAELLLIKEQNKMIKEFQSSQQATVYWALGGVMSFVIVLTGLSLFTNFKFYTQDKERLETDFEARLSEYRVELSLRTEEYLRESEKTSEQRYQNLQDRILNQISEIRLFVEGMRSELVSDIKTSGVKSQEIEKWARQKIATVESSLRDVEVLVWDLRGIPSNMVITHAQAVSAAVESGSQDRVSYMLNQLTRTLENKYIKSNESMPAETLKLLEESLTLASEIDPERVQKARELIAKTTITPADSKQS